MRDVNSPSRLRSIIFHLRIGAVGCLLISLGCLLAEPAMGLLQSDAKQTVVKRVKRYSGDEVLESVCVSQAKQISNQLDSSFQILISSPLIVVGNIDQEKLKNYLAEVIQPVLYSVEYSYFPDGMKQPVTIYLCRDTNSFRKLAWNLDQRKPVSYYGYYHREKRHLLVDISTGMGTLAHELTHVLTHDNFERMAVWLDEGLAALHEECEISADGKRMIGYKNWRGEVALEVMNKPDFSLKRLLEDRSYVELEPREAYAVSRALCLFLQERGKLAEYIAVYQSEFQYDEQGVMSLIEVMGSRNLKELETEFVSWAKTGGI